MPEENIEDLKKQIRLKDARIEELEEKMQAFEGPGKAKMYYAMNRQMSDLADMMNSSNLKKVNLDNKDDKTMERMKIVWSSVKSISEIITILRQSGGITDNEEEDLKRPFIETVAEKRY